MNVCRTRHVGFFSSYFIFVCYMATCSSEQIIKKQGAKGFMFPAVGKSYWPARVFVWCTLFHFIVRKLLSGLTPGEWATSFQNRRCDALMRRMRLTEGHLRRTRFLSLHEYNAAEASTFWFSWIALTRTRCFNTVKSDLYSLFFLRTLFWMNPNFARGL